MSDSKKKKKTVKPIKARTSFEGLETVQFERLLADISARFINLSSEEVNKAITESLECVSQTLGVDRCTLLEFHEDLSVVANFFCYNAPGIKTVTAAGPPSPDSYLKKMVREGEIIYFNRLDELPQEAMVDLEYLQSRGVKSMLFIPVQSKNRTVTVLALSGIRSEYRWPEKLKPRLRLLAEVFTRVLKQKQTEEVILQEKQFTETVINSLPGIFYVYDSDWRMVRWNRNHELLTGFSADELKGRMVLDWFSEDFKEIVATTVRKVFDEGEAMVEAALLLSDGSQTPYLFKGVRLDIAGKPYFMGMGLDISERKAKEEALHRSKQQLHLITDSLPSLISYIDSSQRYIFVNESYAKFVGQPRDEIPGKYMREVLGEDIFEKIREHITTVLSGESVTFQTTVLSPTLGLRDMQVTYVPDFKESEIRGFFASIHDVTEVEKARKQARVAHEALYHVGRVTMLEAISSSLSHEIQQPLTGILSNAQAAEVMINNSKLDIDEIQVIIKDIVADAKRAGGIMWQLRAFLRKQETNLQILNLNQLIEDVLIMLNSDMVIHNVMIEKDLAADLPQVVGDSVQLKQVLINLIINAEQVMEDFAIGLHKLVLHTFVGSMGEIIVAIEDSGPGIEEAQLKKIFEPFYTTKQEGMGMGLAISQFIIESHGGRIWAENQTEQGAKICFSLPAEGRPES